MSTSVNLKNYCDQHPIIIHNKTYNSFSIKPDQLEKNLVPLTLRFLDIFFSAIASKCQSIANLHFVLPKPEQPKFYFPLAAIQKDLEKFGKEILNALEGESVSLSARLLRDIIQIRASSMQLWQPCFERAFKIISDIFESMATDDKQGRKCYSLSRDVFEQKKDKTWTYKIEAFNEILDQVMGKAYPALGCQTDSIAFTSQDYKKFQVAMGVEIVRAASTLICTEFALFKIHELRAKEAIFYHDKRMDISELVPNLIRWGYVGVSDPQEDDLVVYMNQKCNVKHVGRYLSSGMVESKIGNSPLVCRHNIFDVHIKYGSEVIFFRKPSF